MFIFTNVHKLYKCICFAYAFKFSKITFKEKQEEIWQKEKKQE